MMQITLAVCNQYLIISQNNNCLTAFYPWQHGCTVARKQVVKVIWHEASTGHVGATWRLRLNLCFLLPIRVHNQNGKSIGSAIFAQLALESPYTLQWEPLSPKIAPSHLLYDSLGPSELTTQVASRLVQPFLSGLTSVTDRQTTLLNR